MITIKKKEDDSKIILRRIKKVCKFKKDEWTFCGKIIFCIKQMEMDKICKFKTALRESKGCTASADKMLDSARDFRSRIHRNNSGRKV